MENKENITIIIKKQGRELIHKKASSCIFVGLYQGDERTIFQTGMYGFMTASSVHSGIASIVNNIVFEANYPKETVQDKLIFANTLFAAIENHAILTFQDSAYTGDLTTKHGSFELTIMDKEGISLQSNFDSFFLAMMDDVEEELSVEVVWMSSNLTENEVVRSISLMIKSFVHQIMKLKNTDKLHEQLKLVQEVMSDVKWKFLEVFYDRIENPKENDNQNKKENLG
ncbi:hypothetical protein ACFVS2_21315 [Brevibacillus sp. NPDC058079]|uniref:hypothetical protein n=1 Tax=Brevibacillus sp. NPDC058079 TaxID=3346330 RepID=UPI0036E29897